MLKRNITALFHLTNIVIYSYNIYVASAVRRFRHSATRGNAHKGTSQQGGRPKISFYNCLCLPFFV